MQKETCLVYYYNNPSYSVGDAQILYQIIRKYKPSRIIEIGCGFSTLMMQRATKKNKDEGSDCEHICIEPYEMNWLEKLNITIIRKKVEEMDISLFKALKKDDILFIDSSHMIRPQGDVLFGFLEVLPILNKGVIIHIHDIYTPRDYLESWIKDLNRFWNEQYLLETFLTHNKKYKILLATNYLLNKYPDHLLEKCPFLKQSSTKEPGSFWMQKIEN